MDSGHPPVAFIGGGNMCSAIVRGGVDAGVLDPRSSYADPADWETRGRKLAGLFIDNFDQYTDNEAGRALVAFGPQL